VRYGENEKSDSFLVNEAACCLDYVFNKDADAVTAPKSAHKQVLVIAGVINKSLSNNLLTLPDDGWMNSCCLATQT